MTSLVLHRITKASPDIEEMLPRILSLSNEIFGSSPELTKYAALAVWRDRLRLPGAFIVYLAPSPAPHLLVASGIAPDDESSHPSLHATASSPVAFLFAQPRTHAPPLASGVKQTVHIWLAGVLPARRRAGNLGRLVRTAEAAAAAGVLTVSTVPERYPDMWWWLTRRGWVVERQIGGGKVLLVKTLASVGNGTGDTVV